MMGKKILLSLCVLVLVASLGIYINIHMALSQTTSVRIVKYASDGVTVIDELTVDYLWMQSNLPIQGDGSTHYYHQGPTFDPQNLWDPSETVNLKDKGAVRGTAVKDLCSMVGGMNPGDIVRIKAVDNFQKSFSYADVYSPEPAQGRIVLCWYMNGQYVPSFAEGMQLIFFAQTQNGAGQYVFGNWDMHECLAEQYWHYYQSGGISYPSTNGLSIKYINEIAVFPAGSEPSSGGGCFIATAAYGSYVDSHVDTLRSYRDNYMLTNNIGSELVSAYYTISPSIAAYIDSHAILKPVVRTALLPSVAVSDVSINMNITEKAALLGFFGLISVLPSAWLWNRRKLLNS